MFRFACTHTFALQLYCYVGTRSDILLFGYILYVVRCTLYVFRVSRTNVNHTGQWERLQWIFVFYYFSSLEIWFHIRNWMYVVCAQCESLFSFTFFSFRFGAPYHLVLVVIIITLRFHWTLPENTRKNIKNLIFISSISFLFLFFFFFLATKFQWQILMLLTQRRAANCVISTNYRLEYTRIYFLSHQRSNTGLVRWTLNRCVAHSRPQTIPRPLKSLIQFHHKKKKEKRTLFIIAMRAQCTCVRVFDMTHWQVTTPNWNTK